ncbi:MAG: tetratricopeptide repeat protein [Deltaproteobacteria bacterium]|nr:tetratricopeptide repeat protein [Deltaproteobacteria bacterium]
MSLVPSLLVAVSLFLFSVNTFADEVSDSKKRVSLAAEHFKSGVKLKKAGRHEQAVEEFRQAINLHPNYNIYKSLAESLVAIDKYEAAIEAYEAYLSNGGDKIDSTTQADVDKEIVRLRDSLAKKNAQGNYTKGRELYSNNQYEEALKEFEEAYKLDPSSRHAYSIARTAQSLNYHEKAIQNYRLYLPSVKDPATKQKTVETISRLEKLVEEESNASKREEVAQCRHQCNESYDICAKENAPNCDPRASTPKKETQPASSRVMIPTLDDDTKSQESPEEDCDQLLADCVDTRESCLAECGPIPLTTVAAAHEAPKASGDEYDQLLAKAQATTQQRDEYNKRLEETWGKIKQIAGAETLSQSQRIAAVEKFLADFPENNPHEHKARRLIELIESNDDISELDDFVDPAYMRTKTEWYGMRFAVGILGGSITIELFSIRWRYFVLTLLRGTWIGGWGGIGGHGGIGLAVPLHVGTDGRREFRFGLGLEGGGFDSFLVENKNTCWDEESDGNGNYYCSNYGNAFAYGPMIVPEFVYHWHSHRHFGFQTGLEVHIFPLHDSNDPLPPHIDLFVGFSV